MRSVMNHEFSKVPVVDIPRSSFDRSHGLKTTFNSGYLVPFFFDEALPGDTFNLDAHGFVRMATPLFPVMDNLHLETFFFFVPLRLLWDNFQRMMGEQDNPTDSVDFEFPILVAADGNPATSFSFSEQSVYDYFGLPIGVNFVGNDYISSTPFRAMNLIYNQWFRDQNLQDSVPFYKTDGPDPIDDFTLLRRGKRHDYFTSCLPWTQKAANAVTLPLGTSAPITIPWAGGAAAAMNPTVKASGDSKYYNLKTSSTYLESVNNPAGGTTSTTDAMYADLSNATAASINALRLAIATQSFYELDARAGTRYVEHVMAHFEVQDPMALVLNQPEFLGGSSENVNIHPVAQTSGTSASGTTTPLGNLAAMGTVVAKSNFTKSFTEHGVLLGLMSVRADLNYQKGLDKMFTRGLAGRFDFYYPMFAHIGEQAVYNKEIYYNNDANDSLVFGYQEAYADLRFKRNTITGLLRSQAASTLDIWHLAQKFTSLPTLNSTFIQSNTDLDRVIATPTQPHFIFDVYNELISVRVMPVYSVPGLMVRL